ncbi:unnamed protein product, partial [Polarella glacialis]
MPFATGGALGSVLADSAPADRRLSACTSTDQCQVIQDVAQGWEGLCLGLEQLNHSTTPEYCRDKCCGDPKCEVWQWGTDRDSAAATLGMCYTGRGLECQSERFDNLLVRAGQRISHGQVSETVPLEKAHLSHCGVMEETFGCCGKLWLLWRHGRNCSTAETLTQPLSHNGTKASAEASEMLALAEDKPSFGEVCFEVMGGACPVHKLSCGHKFHHACIQRWLRQKGQSASCPLCKATPKGECTEEEPAPFRIDLGHQEMSRILTELEDIFEVIHEVAGPLRPMSISGLASNLCTSLGYEDEDELEEAIGGSLVDFLGALPHFEVIWPSPDDASSGTTTLPGWPKALMKPAELEVESERLAAVATKTSFTVSEREDLWRIVLQGPEASIEIPELEFAIRPQERRRIDTIYNIIAAAIFHLGDHIQKNSREGGVISSDHIDGICSTIDSLNVLLDVDRPFTVVIVDPQ